MQKREKEDLKWKRDEHSLAKTWRSFSGAISLDYRRPAVQFSSATFCVSGVSGAGLPHYTHPIQSPMEVIYFPSSFVRQSPTITSFSSLLFGPFYTPLMLTLLFRFITITTWIGESLSSSIFFLKNYPYSW